MAAGCLATPITMDYNFLMLYAYQQGQYREGLRIPSGPEPVFDALQGLRRPGPSLRSEQWT